VVLSSEDGEVLIVGGGPAGLQLARFLGKLGVAARLYEEHDRVGLPQHCTSLVSLEGLRKHIGVSERRVVSHRVLGAWVIGPSGTRLLLERERPVAAVLRRPALEEALLDEASERAEVVLGRRVNPRALRGGWVVDARGVVSLIEREPGAARYVLPALQYDVRVLDSCGGEHVFVFLGEKFSRGLFAWAIPIADGVYRVGLASRGAVLARLSLLLRRLPALTGCLKPLDRLRVYGGAVYTGGMLSRLVRGPVILIGDSAGQTKPTTGGGLVYLSIAARKLAAALEAGSPALYERAIVAELGTEMKAQLLVRRLLNLLSDRELDAAMELLKLEGAEQMISREGSMDRQAPTVVKMAGLVALRSPRLAVTLLSKLVSSLLEAQL